MPRTTKCGFKSAPGTPTGQELLTIYGPTLFVNIGFDPAYKTTQTAAPIPGIEKVEALVDTGASESCIDALLAAQLKLPVIDRRKIAGVGGEQEVNLYLAQVRIPSLDSTIYGAFAGVHLVSGGQMHKALIGRTFLQHFRMVYDGPTGDVTISDGVAPSAAPAAPPPAAT